MRNLGQLPNADWRAVAWDIPIASIRTDPGRFQNRSDAFSELSADAVASSFDANKFDPIVIWPDPNRKGQLYVLSGHSRYEGIKRRKLDNIPARIFNGTEAEAVQFARVDANRAATAESLVEDLKAYKLMRDGDEGRNLKPAAKAELRRAFKGKATKLDAWTHLSPNGKFVLGLSADSRSEYPRIEPLAAMVGKLRAEFGDAFTDTHERDVFNYLYSDKAGYRQKADELDKLIRERIELGKERLFPECDDDGACRPVKDVQELLRSRRERELHQELQKVTDAINTLEDRFRSNVPARRVHTDPEREALRVLLASYKDDKTRLQRELGVAEKVKDEPGLFGLGAVPGYKWRRVMSGREVARMLEHNEWTYQRTSGSHMNFKKGECRVTVPDHTELKKGTLASIKRVVEECESSLNLP